MNRRTFIKRSFMLMCLAALKPFELANKLSVVKLSGVQLWRKRILDLYPEANAPLIKLLENRARGIKDPGFSWWTV